MANIILFTLWCLIGLIGIALIILLSINGGSWTGWLYAILLLMLSVYKLFFSRFVVWSNRYRMMANMYGVSEWTRTTEFTDDEIILTDHTSVTRLKYENIKKVKEQKNTVTIFFNNNVAIRLHKDAFVEGSWQECKQKISKMRK